MKKYIKSVFVILLCFILLAPNVSMASELENTDEITLNKTVEFEFTYNEEKDNGKVAASYTYVPRSTGYYDVLLSDFIGEDTFLGIFDSQGKRLVFKGFADADDDGKVSINLKAGQKYYFVVFYCKPDSSGNNDFDAIAVNNDVKFPSQPDNIKCTTTAGTKLGFSRCYKAELLKDAKKVDIYVNFNSEAGEKEVELFIGKSYDNKAKTKIVKVSAPGWFTLDLSDVSIEDISSNGIFYVGFECVDKATEKQLVSCSANCNSDYFADSKLYSTTSTGRWYSQNATQYNGFCALFYYNELDFKLKRNVTEVEEKKPLRIIFVSDSHYGTDDAGTPSGDDTYDLARGTRGDERSQLMVDAINAEHHKAPVDFVIFAGDLRSISTKNIKTKNEDLEKLRDNWLSQLEMPYYAFRGNHDAYTNEDWKRILGCDTQFTIETDDYVFICVDVYDYEKAPFYDKDGNHIPTFKYSGCDVYYTGMAPQMDWIREEVDKAKAKNKKIWIVSHHLSHTTPESAGTGEKIDETEFIKLFSEEDSILGIIKGHAHIPVLMHSISIADKSVNDGKGYTIPKWHINTGNFGAIPLNSKGVTPNSYRFGFKVLEMQDDGLKAYHVYPAETYPRWKSTTVTGEYENKSFAYERTGMSTVDVPVVENKDFDVTIRSKITLRKHIHSFDSQPLIKRKATCTQTGILIRTCSDCNTQVYVSQPKCPHKYVVSFTKATLKSDGAVTTRCISCNRAVTSKTVAKPVGFKLSATSFVYDGKAKTPKVVVTDSRGRVISASNYTVSYSNNRNVGRAMAVVTFRGDYSGTKILYFTIKKPVNTKK